MSLTNSRENTVSYITQNPTHKTFFKVSGLSGSIDAKFFENNFTFVDSTRERFASERDALYS